MLINKEQLQDDARFWLMQTVIDLSGRLIDFMEEKGFQPYELARMLGMSSSTFDEVLNGKLSSLSAEEFVRLLMASGVLLEPRYFLKGRSVPNDFFTSFTSSFNGQKPKFKYSKSLFDIPIEGYDDSPQVNPFDGNETSTFDDFTQAMTDNSESGEDCECSCCHNCGCGKRKNDGRDPQAFDEAVVQGFSEKDKKRTKSTKSKDNSGSINVSEKNEEEKCGNKGRESFCNSIRGDSETIEFLKKFVNIMDMQPNQSLNEQLRKFGLSQLF